MRRNWLAPVVRAGVLAAVCLAIGVPAVAQQLGSLKGRVVDEAGNPVADAEISFDYTGEMNYHWTAKTNENGEWTRAGLYAVGGRWTITAKKGDMAGFLADVEVPLSGIADAGDIVIRKGGNVPSSTSGMTAAEAEARNKQQAALKKLLDEVNLALSNNSYDEAITKLQEASTQVENCTICYVQMGDVYMKKNDLAQAETAYKKAAELDPTSPDPYDSLAVLYNSQKKFDEAAAASAKAAELHGAGAGAGGGGDATSLYNAGAILVNQGKMAEAQAQFEKAIKADPTMAEAHYQLAMTLVNQGKVADAVKALETYLSLNPTGPNAQMAKDMLPELKKMQ